MDTKLWLIIKISNQKIIVFFYVSINAFVLFILLAWHHHTSLGPRGTGRLPHLKKCWILHPHLLPNLCGSILKQTLVIASLSQWTNCELQIIFLDSNSPSFSDCSVDVCSSWLSRLSQAASSVSCSFKMGWITEIHQHRLVETGNTTVSINSYSKTTTHIMTTKKVNEGDHQHRWKIHLFNFPSNRNNLV